jgi:transcriptional regulator with XRE-family HTH domain
MTAKNASDAQSLANLRWDSEGFPDRLQRAKGGLSTNAFAQKCGISESIFRKYLAGVSVPGADKLVDIARAGRMSLVWLATGQGRADAPNAPSPVDEALLERVIEAVEAALEQIDGVLTPAKKAKLVAVLYGLYQTEAEVRQGPVLELVKLTA